jgi:hypothetical protein
MSGKIIGNILITIATLLFIIVGFAGMQSLSQAPRRYSETKSFNTLEEAQVYQTQIISETLSRGGKVVSSDLTVASPPNLTWEIILPGNEWIPSKVEPFPYGHNTGLITPWIGLIIIWVLCLAFFIFTNLLIWELIGKPKKIK